MANVNTQFINYFITQLLNAAKGGFTVNVNDPDEVGQYALAIIGLGADLIPEIGPALGALCNLLGVVLFHPNSMENI